MITQSSFIDLNNSDADIRPISSEKAIKNIISSDFAEETILFEKALTSFGNNGVDFSRKLGNDLPKALARHQNYGFLRYNCGGWAKFITDKASLNWPLAGYFYNLGVGVDGLMYYPALAIDAAIRTGYEVYDNLEPVEFSSSEPFGDPQVYPGINIEF